MPAPRPRTWAGKRLVTYNMQGRTEKDIAAGSTIPSTMKAMATTPAGGASPGPRSAAPTTPSTSSSAGKRRIMEAPPPASIDVVAPKRSPTKETGSVITNWTILERAARPSAEVAEKLHVFRNHFTKYKGR
mmetsp:Transcript_14450/g.36517  ORF Transcript_14450/g.36517 Transcript_14450/m.36517 type:complete len:131 (-) Transcript_14450:1132-1524(-)